MPELPEVEIIKRGLEKELVGQKLRKIEIFNPGYILKNIKNITALVGTRLNSIERKGKFLIFLFEKEFLLFHLSLTGFFILYNQKDVLNLNKEKRHLILTFNFERHKLNYFDIRKFGKIKKRNIKEMLYIKELKELGKDAIEINFDEFKTILGTKDRNIKNLLMDQKIISGLGNIYTNELLFRAKINPFKSSKDLKEEEIKRLFFEMKKLLKEAIELGGSSIRNYVDVKGRRGKFQEKFLVYSKKGQPCPECGRPIRYQKIAQRGTFYCQNCQPI